MLALTFRQWCDYIENSVNETDPSKIPGAEGVGTEKAVAGYAAWAKDYFVDFCNETYSYFAPGLNTVSRQHAESWPKGR